jgi:hypothetical protein
MRVSIVSSSHEAVDPLARVELLRHAPATAKRGRATSTSFAPTASREGEVIYGGQTIRRYFETPMRVR